jgi:hypothetical protein
MQFAIGWKTGLPESKIPRLCPRAEARLARESRLLIARHSISAPGQLTSSAILKGYRRKCSR